MTIVCNLYFIPNSITCVIKRPAYSGPAGLSAAVAARKNGTESILILERDKELGGILNQCIHNGFGLHTFQEELTGPEYAGRYPGILSAPRERSLHPIARITAFAWI